eukprot:scaffold667625_cov102-Prasinocladus_malaysianus.AAC.1
MEMKTEMERYSADAIFPSRDMKRAMWHDFDVYFCYQRMRAVSMTPPGSTGSVKSEKTADRGTCEWSVQAARRLFTPLKESNAQGTVPAVAGSTTKPTQKMPDQ